MEPKSKSALQIEEYLNAFTETVKEKQLFATIGYATIRQTIYPNHNLIVILSESELGGMTDIDPELSIPINSDLYHSRDVIEHVLKSLCKIISLEHTPIIQVTDCPDKPRIEINISSNSKDTKFTNCKTTLMKMLPDYLIGTDTTQKTAPVFAYLNHIENEKLTIEKYINQNGNFADTLKWLIAFKEFIVDADPWSTDIMLEKSQEQTYAIIDHDYNHTGHSDEITYPIPVPGDLRDTRFLEAVAEMERTLAYIKNWSIKIIRNDENIIIYTNNDPKRPFTLR